MISIFGHSRIWAIIPAFILALLIPSAARADIVYTFIKLTCDPDSRSAVISAFYDQNESGAARAKRHEKDVYPLGGRDGTNSEQKGQCILGNGQTISFLAVQGDMPKHDIFKLFVNGKHVEDTELGYGEWDLFIQSISRDSFDETFCPSEEAAFYFFRQSTPAGNGKKLCSVDRVVNGKAGKSQIVERQTE